MRTSSREYLNRRNYLSSRITLLTNIVQSDPKNIVDAGWIDAGAMAYAAKLVDKAILELKTI